MAAKTLQKNLQNIAKRLQTWFRVVKSGVPVHRRPYTPKYRLVLRHLHYERFKVKDIRVGSSSYSEIYRATTTNMAGTRPLVLLVLVFYIIGSIKGEYLGKFLGKLSELHHGVSGEVYAVDGRTLHIKDFTYDGQGPAAYFYASTYKTPDSRGFRLRDENNNGDVIRRYRKEGVTLTLPEGKNLNNIKIFYVWCEEFDVNFGDVKIPRNFDFPRPQKIDALAGVHSISSDNIVIVDAQTLLIPNLHYDGEAPDAKFWVGRGPKPSPQGIRVPDENGKELPLRRYDGKTVVLTLPGDLTVFDIGHFGIWCEQFTVDFGHVQIPQSVNIPPSLKMLGVSPQSKLNCEVLDENLAFEVRWAVAGESIVLQLVAKLDAREYMSFGLSGDVSRSVMVGGDVVVAWVDKDTLKGYAQDYYLKDKSQCSGPTGSCPDDRFRENTNNIRLLNAALVNGYSIVTYQRPLKASDEFDLPIYTNQSQAILWAIGPLNQRDEVSFHTHYLKRDSFIDFARPAKWNCPLPEGDSPPRRHATVEKKPVVEQSAPVEVLEEEYVEPPTTPAPKRNPGHRRRGPSRVTSRPVATDQDDEEGQASKKEPTRTRGTNKVSQRGTQTVPPPTPVKERNDAWYIPPIECYEPEDGVFYAQMGPTGGKRGYPAITGHVGWGISWYINGLLIPEINVVRGKTYNFIVEGGDNPEVSAKYHPFYITDDPIGGYAYKTPEERKNVTIFSGVRFDKNGEAIPTGTGRLCHWTHTGDSDAEDFDSFGAYQRTLQLKCDVGEPGVITWTPDDNTPDTVYYQCFTHRHLGWKINVHDSCDQSGAASELQQTIVEAPANVNLKSFDVELEASPSILLEATVMPNRILFGGITEDNRSQPTISETINPPPSPTRTSQELVQILNTPSFSFQSPSPTPQSHYIDLKPTTMTLGHLTDNHALFIRNNTYKTSGQPLTTNNKFTGEKLYSVQLKQPYFTKNKVYFSAKKPVYRQTVVTNSPVIKSIEISPIQASTEKDPEIKKFDHRSVVMERGGFTPIKSKVENLQPEVDPEGQSGVIRISPTLHNPSKLNPVYLTTETKNHNKIHPRSLINSDIEPIMAAAERVESYYLPPPGQTEKPKSAKQPSNIDFEAPSPPEKVKNKKVTTSPKLVTSAVSPPDTVVTFDGKTVSGASLTAKLFDKPLQLERGSKATELLKAHPQSVPFRGDLPPLSPNVLFTGNPVRTSGVLNRDLDTPLLSSGSTKLQRV